jgi:hypothetical protein
MGTSQFLAPNIWCEKPVAVAVWDRSVPGIHRVQKPVF